MMSALIILVIGLLLVIVLIGMYNSLIRLRNAVQNAWSQIDVQLKRRHDLIPNLIESVKGYMVHEKSVLENITKYRSAALEANNIGDISKAESALTGALGQLKIAMENYPDLKANQNFLALQEELSSTENKISFSRQNYNDQVMLYNNKIQMFPSNIIASMFNFKSSEFFEIEDNTEREVPKVSFN